MNAPDPAVADLKVSVCMITYNQESFVEQAIQSVLMQEADFEYELVIGEDCSTDSTRDIVQAYGERYPQRIRLFLPERNRGVTRNFAATLKACRGQYVALLEGDDYWTAPHKLQEQVNYLENNPGCSMCFHNGDNLQPDGSRQDYVRRFGIRIKPQYSLRDILTSNFIPTCSVMFRNGLIAELPKEAYETPALDILLYVLLAQEGRLGYIDEKWAVRRVHPGGVWSGQSETDRQLGDIRWLQAIDSYLRFKYHAVIGPAIAQHWYALVSESLGVAVEHGSVAWTLKDVEDELLRWYRRLYIPDSVRDYVLGRACIDLAGTALRAGDRSKARAWLLNAVQHYPSFVRDVYLWSHAAEVLLGQRMAGWLRSYVSPAYHSRLLSLLRR